MTQEGLKLFRPDLFGVVSDLSAEDVFLSDLATAETHSGTDQPTSRDIKERLVAITDAVRQAACARTTVAWNGAILRDAVERYPAIVDSLPDDQKAQFLEIVSRMAVTNTTASATPEQL